MTKHELDRNLLCFLLLSLSAFAQAAGGKAALSTATADLQQGQAVMSVMVKGPSWIELTVSCDKRFFAPCLKATPRLLSENRPFVLVRIVRGATRWKDDYRLRVDGRHSFEEVAAVTQKFDLHYKLDLASYSQMTH